MSSPSYFSNVWQNYVPQGHEKALKQALFTGISNLLVLVAIGGVVAVYFILEAFLRPLSWALLCGTFLYPIKRSFTSTILQWMTDLKSSGTPLVIGVVILPWTLLDGYSNALRAKLQENGMIITTIVIGLPSVYFVYHFAFGSLEYLFGMVISLIGLSHNTITYFSSLWLWTVFVAYLVMILLSSSSDVGTSESSNTDTNDGGASFLHLPVWILFILHISALAEPFQLPVLGVIIIISVVGYYFEIQKSEGSTTVENDNGTSQETAKREATNWSFKRLDDTTDESQSMSKKPEKPKTLSPLKLKSPETSSLTGSCFRVLFWGHLLVRLWMHLWIILLIFTIPLIFIVFKKIWEILHSENVLGNTIKGVKGRFKNVFMSDNGGFLPKALQGFVNLTYQMDQKAINILENSMDSMTSVLLILAMIIGTLSFTIIGGVQIHQESMLMITMTSSLLNETLHPEISEWLPDSDSMQDAMDSVVGNAYYYGRNWLLSKAHEFVDGNTTSNELFEQQILTVYDSLYESWIWKNSTKPSVDLSQQLTQGSNISSVWEYISAGDGIFDVSSLVQFGKDNLGTFLSVFDSIWFVIRSNMNVVFGLLTGALSMVFGGGTAILNFTISAVIFFTTLFYLLASSKKSYKPVEWFTNLLPQSGDSNAGGIGQTVQEAISSVFMASLKMSAFYGLFTWLTHLVFNVDIVFIPSVLAAIFGAVPFVGTYWAAVPGALELWALKGCGGMAIALIMCHMLPAYVVDTAIYSEIKGGHPFLTGLAIAGGMYYLGLEGAFIGPILLCTLLVVVNLSSSFLKPDR